MLKQMFCADALSAPIGACSARRVRFGAYFVCGGVLVTRGRRRARTEHIRVPLASPPLCAGAPRGKHASQCVRQAPKPAIEQVRGRASGAGGHPFDALLRN